jgi:hypothetical protein
MNKGLTKIEIQKFWGVFHIFWWRNYGIRESPQNKTILQIESESMWGENVKWEAPFSTRSNIFEWVLHLKDTAILKVESSILQIRYTNRHWPKSPEIHWYRHWRIKKPQIIGRKTQMIRFALMYSPASPHMAKTSPTLPLIVQYIRLQRQTYIAKLEKLV